MIENKTGLLRAGGHRLPAKAAAPEVSAEQMRNCK